ncbi:DUF4190 domain-containing protein [Streptomyces sp. NPDC002573]|uniref:DUF4190 domain-containing protein n=1 Tax=Streptomyces sp. NPDC002573 TaxID=3364651 RepID=UPI003677680D
MNLTATRNETTTPADDTTTTRADRNATTPESRTGTRDAEGMAVASFILGLLGLLVLNVFLGPVAIALAAVALWRGTQRRGRAYLGLGLGIADLVVLVALMQMDHTVSWSI